MRISRERKPKGSRRALPLVGAIGSGGAAFWLAWPAPEGGRGVLLLGVTLAVAAGLMVRTWKISLIVILIVAAVVSPTNDIPNMLLFAAPMILLYIISIFIAWIFGKKRQTDEEANA